MPTDPPAEKRNSSLTQNMEEAADAGYQKQHAVLSDWKKTDGIGYAMAAPAAIRFGAITIDATTTSN